MTYREGLRAVTGNGEYIDDLPSPPGTLHMAILRSPYPHAVVRKIDVSEVRRRGGVAYTSEDLLRVVKAPFPNALGLPIDYYPFAVGKARYFGEPLAVVLADDVYKAVDLLDYVEVDLEPLEPVVTIDDALRGRALVHEKLGSNVAMRKNMKFGDVEGFFKAADDVVRLEFKFPKHTAMPLEPYGVLASWRGDELYLTANFQGPMLYVYFIARALGLSTAQLHIKTPRDIGGSFGIKYSIYPYAVLAAASSRLAGRPVKWVETRQENLVASSSNGERRGYVELALRRDGRITAVRYHFIEDVGAYLRPPEPGALFRIHGNLNGAYDIKAIEADYTVVFTNKSPTGLNRGYGGPQFYFALERAVEEAARRLGLDPLEFRIRNLVREFPVTVGSQKFYETPTGGLYPAQDYVTVVKALEPEYRRWQEEKRRGRRVGVGIAVVVEPSGTNLGYVDVALDAEKRKYPHSGAGEYVTVSVDPNGVVEVFVNATNEGLGHETALAEVVARELGVKPEDVKVVFQTDTDKLWALSSGSYSSRFAPVVISAAIEACRRLKEKVMLLGAHYLKARRVAYSDGYVVDLDRPERRIDLKRIASAVHWDPGGLPEGMEGGLVATAYFQPPTVRAPVGDRVNSSAAYAIQAHLAVVELGDEGIKLVRYVVAHDAGRIIKRELLDGQLHGGIHHGVAMALYEELRYGPDGTPKSLLLDTYGTPTLAEFVDVDVGLIHFETPAVYLPSGAYGAGEGPVMGAPAAVANAVSDLLGVPINELPVRLEALI
ncbi:xanthine dehydrogenase family protein molybdopterin-binding subunit [Pyrobaculum ferrireducens]|uniref:Molybdopterin binding oxidoreductase large subunit n=1 Tax=Pyrobaculum ferrireducens TaxID=1104324 RepID=G7VCF6_9CREN|nr:xanthine dehydrogenase family protein molybdopterin-binding subunit [Pyrobaculum ferrireducens]AET32576.1 molybdopterin binding oxidoreductase large subunit [Pyrobaculum ferrireducens]